MDQNKNVIQIDPDYEINTTAIRNVELKEERENELTEEKLKKIIQDEFDKEIALRQKQMEDIEYQIFKAQKLLHVVRYVLVTSYYNKKALQYDTTQEEFSMDSLNTLKGQNRIHPAVKKLLGAGANVQHMKFLGSRHKRKEPTDTGTSKDQTESLTFEAEEVPAKKIKLTSEDNSSTSSLDQTSVKFSSDSSTTTEIDSNVSMNRKKTEHKILVGNISYCKKSIEQDNLTHKWMVYVRVYRGSKDGPDVSNMIKKVVFYLHPSYKPHDVVEISASPFHLSRRGWGEFPVRVKILFNNPLNKPVDIIHNLKLSKTFIGRQTIGNETVVPIFLHSDTYVPVNKEVQHNPDEIQFKFQYDKESLSENATEIQNEPAFNDSEIPQQCSEDLLNLQFNDHSTKQEESSKSLGFEHDYCSDETVVNTEPDGAVTIEECGPEGHLIDTLDMENSVYAHGSQSEPELTSSRDHSYSLPNSCNNSLFADKSNNSLNSSAIEQPYNELMYGLGDHYLTNGRRVINTVKKTPQKSSPVKSNNMNKMMILKTASGQAIRFLPYNLSQVLLANGSIVEVKLLNQAVAKPKEPPHKLSTNNSSTKSPGANTYYQLVNNNHVQQQKIDYEKYKLKLPENTFKNMGEVLPYLFKRLPLWSDLVKDLDFKCTYPFTAKSCKEFMSWNVGKRLSAEWSRAKTIKKLLQNQSFCTKRWNTKAIFMYGRSHLYTPCVSSYKTLQSTTRESQAVKECFYGSVYRGSLSSAMSRIDEDCIDVDVVSENDTSTRISNGVIDITDNTLQPHCSFIKEAALDCGVYLKPEEIIEGVSFNAAERVILEAVKCFAEGLIRRARHHLVSRYHFSGNPTEITVNEVNKALDERPEFQVLRNFRRQKFDMDFFS